MRSALQGNAPPFYRFFVGSASGTIVSDGTIPLGDRYTPFGDLDPDAIDLQLADNFLTGEIRLEQNILVVRLRGRTIIFDTGKGPVDLPGYRTGRLQDSLASAGIDPKGVDAVVISHAHSDHCGGCMSVGGRSHFPHAQFYMAEADFDFWTEPGNVSGGYRAWVDIARRNLLPHRDRMQFFRDGDEFLPGVYAIHAPGHTVGNTVFMIEDEGQQLCLIGDIAHHNVLLLRNPAVRFVHDTDPDLGARTRVRILSMLADGRIRTLGYHFPWPGIGHIARHGDGFQFVPEPMVLG